jgi:hypothetical protein
VDNETREVLATFDDVDAHSQLDFSPDGSLLVAGGTNGLATLIDGRAAHRRGAAARYRRPGRQPVLISVEKDIIVGATTDLDREDLGGGS